MWSYAIGLFYTIHTELSRTKKNSLKGLLVDSSWCINVGIETWVFLYTKTVLCYWTHLQKHSVQYKG